MIERLIAFDTTSRSSNLRLIDWVRDYLDGLGIESRLTFDDSGMKANLFATIGPERAGGIVLSGHTDVVPVDGQNWQSDPFRAERRDDRLFGRGSADMKSFIGIALARVPALIERRLERPIHLALSYDEEVGCIGVRRLLADLQAQSIRPSACIVGEPTSMRVVTGHKGKLSMRCHVRGLECHSALTDRGVNAIEAAAGAITHLKAMARRRREQGPFDRGYDPPYTTINTGVIRGGTALNIVPNECCFDFEFRYLPGESPAELRAEIEAFCATHLLPEMTAVTEAAAFQFDELAGGPGLDAADDAEITQMVTLLTGNQSTGKVAFGTEAGLFEAAGIPAIVCGPGSIEQAHKPDEFIDLEQIALCEGFIDRLIDRVAVR